MKIKKQNIATVLIMPFMLVSPLFMAKSLFNRVLAFPLSGPITPPVVTVTPPVSPPFVTVTPSPKITPTPTKNRAPEILTVTLPKATVNAKYMAALSIIDKDGDLITVKVGGLPKGYSINCNNLPGMSRCVISGKTNKTGTYLVAVQAKDGRGLTTKKVLTLQVVKEMRRIH